MMKCKYIQMKISSKYAMQHYEINQERNNYATQCNQWREEREMIVKIIND